MFTKKYSPEQTRLVTPLHGVVSTWFEEQVAAHAAQNSDIDPISAKLQLPQHVSILITKQLGTNN